MRYVSRRWQRIVLLAVIVPFWTSYLLRVYAWQAILGERGVINQVLMGLGIIDEPTRLLAYNDLSVFIVLVYVYFPFAALALYASLERFDFGQLQAAQDLGARPDQAFRHILLPQIRPGHHHRLHLRVHPDHRGVPHARSWSAGRRACSSRNLVINFFRARPDRPGRCLRDRHRGLRDGAARSSSGGTSRSRTSWPVASSIDPLETMPVSPHARLTRRAAVALGARS